MTTVNLIGLRGNDRRRESVLGIGQLDFNIPQNELVSGDVYQVAVVPAGAIVKSVNIVVDTAFNGTTPTIDVGVTGSGAAYTDDLDLTATGLTVSATADALYAEGTIITITPTFTDTTTGKVRVYVEYLTTAFTGAYATEQ